MERTENESPARPSPRPRIVLSGPTAARGVLVVVGDALPITHGVGICILLQRDCELVISNLAAT